MKTASEELKKLRLMAEQSLNKSDELNKLLSQLEATLDNAEAIKFNNKD